MFQNCKIGLILLMLCSCSTIKYVPVENQITYTYKDSTIIHTDTVQVEIPKEVIKEVVYADSSHLETSVAVSNACVDTLGFLHHSLENKPVSLKKEIIYQDKIIQKDSIVVQEVPVEVQVEKQYIPKWAWISLVLNIIVVIIIAIKLYLKFK